jgi:pyruvate carboxylase
MSPGARHSLPRHRRIPDPAGRAHPAERRAGAVTLIQRFGSALNLNIHFHTHYDKAKHLMATFGAACWEAVEASETGQGGAGAALSTA